MVRRIQVGILAEAGLFRQALCRRLAAEEEIEVASAAATIRDVVLRARGRSVDVLLVSRQIPAGLAREILFDVQLLSSATRIVVLGCAPGDGEAVRWLEAGVCAWLGDEASYERLRETIFCASQGRTFCAPEQVTEVALRIARLDLAARKAKAPEHEPLTDRQREVLQLLRLGLSNKTMARRLGLKTNSIKAVVSQVLRKLGTRCRADLDLRTTSGGNVEEG